MSRDVFVVQYKLNLMSPCVFSERSIVCLFRINLCNCNDVFVCLFVWLVVYIQGIPGKASTSWVGSAVCCCFSYYFEKDRFPVEYNMIHCHFIFRFTKINYCKIKVQDLDSIQQKRYCNSISSL